MTPVIDSTQFDSPIGRIAVIASPIAILKIAIDGEFVNDGEFINHQSLAFKAKEQLMEFFNGCRQVFNLPLDWDSLCGFQRDVLQMTFNIPFGEVRTYGQIAGQLGKPGAARAAGAVLARNPLPILIPCHRVVAASGHLTGYLGGKGIAAKQWLLEREGHRVVSQKLG